MDGDALRILDANANRAREALRLLEDYARFSLDDASIALTLKSCRHELAGIVAQLGVNALLASRHTAGDVGRATKTPQELSRRSLEDVVRAEFARLAEAARALGEYGKLISADAARAAEEMRYRVYELEQLVALRGPLRRRLRAARICVLLTERLCRRSWRETAEAVLRGGADCVQLREKELPDGELLHRAIALRELVDGRALVLVNDRPDIARLAGADGVHVGQGDLSVEHARRIAGGRILVGKSTHTPSEIRAALAEQPDYLAVGPMFNSATKPQTPVAGPQLLALARPLTDLPLVAIGGITPENINGLDLPRARQSAVCIAVCASVIGADDPEGAVRALRAAMDRAGAS